jgi:hypothetical protein
VSAVLARLERWQVLALVALPVVWAWIVFSPGFATDPDSYYHAGVARHLVEDGWVRHFEWLPHTTLADPYPNMYVGQHVLLAPFVALFGPDTGMRIGVLALSSGFALSVFAVLRRRGVRWPAPWVVLGMLACPALLTYAVFLKGATTFLIVLPWFVDAVWSGARRRTFVLAWLSVYVYVGATVLVPFALVVMLVVRWWDERWDAGCVVATLAGIVAGMLVNPSWPAHWGYVAAELGTIFERDGVLVPGEFRGAEWALVTSDMLVFLVGGVLVAWGVVLMRQLGRAARVSAAGASGAIAAFGLLGAGLLSGTKMIHLFAVMSLLTVPVLAEQMAPWPRRIAPALAAAAALAVAVWSVTHLHDELRDTQGLVRPRDYRAMAAWLDERTAPRETVVAPWDDMPGLFLFTQRDQRFVAGVNVQFLRDHDLRRFEAYALLYRGQIRDPERALPTFFDGARYVLVRRIAHFPGEPALTSSLAQNPAFEELAAPTQAWRIFRLRTPAGPP